MILLTKNKTHAKMRIFYTYFMSFPCFATFHLYVNFAPVQRFQAVINLVRIFLNFEPDLPLVSRGLRRGQERGKAPSLL